MNLLIKQFSYEIKSIFRMPLGCQISDHREQ